MRLTFYDSNLQKKAIEYTWISLLWDVMYNDVGSFVVEFQATTELNNLITETDCVVFDEDDSGTVMIVWSIETKDNKIIISGDAAVSLFDNRISQEVVKNENAELAMRRLVENMSEWPCVENGVLRELPDKFERQKSDDTLLNYFIKIAQNCDMGFTLRQNNDKLLFEVYKPGLNNSTVFAPRFGNLYDESYSRSEKKFRNVAVVAGQAEESGERIEVVVGDVDLSGSGRREMYIDARDLQMKENETLDEYKERLKERGYKKLSEQIKTSVFDFSLSPDEDVKLGDIVSIQPSFLPTPYEARVQYITYKSQNNTMKKNIGIGTLIPRKRG